MADYISQFTGAEIDQRLAKVSQLETSKQDKLVSGSNIKTINGQSVLGSGDMQIQAGDTDAVKYVAQTLTDAQKAQARTNIAAASAAELGQIVTDLTGIEADIDSLEAAVAAINVGDYVTATTLPTASASTMGHIYLIGPDANNNYDRYFTQESSGTYSWVSLGSTQIDLSTYATQAEVDQLEAKLPMLGGYLVPLLRKVVYKDNDAESLIAGINALLNTVEVTSISAVYTQPGTIYAGQPLDDLKANLVVTANYNDGSSAEVSAYELSGTLTAGTSSILVTYQEFTTTFNVTVTDAVHYRDGSYIPGGVALRNAATSSNLSQCYTYDGVKYVFTNGSSTTAAKRCSYFLFDLLLTAGKQYKFTVEFNSAPSSSQTFDIGIGYYDETYRQAGVANVYQVCDYASHLNDSGWQTTTKSGNTITMSLITPEGCVGGRLTMKYKSSGTESNWPSSITVKRLIIQEVTE